MLTLAACLLFAIRRHFARLAPAVLAFLLAAGLAVAQVAPGLPDRVAELETIERQAADARPRTEATLATLRAGAPAYEQALASVQAVPLTTPERKALHEQGLTGLDPAKAQVFAAAAPAFARQAGALAAHFEAYDAENAAEIEGIVLGDVLATLRKVEALGALDAAQHARVDPLLAAVAQAEAKYRAALADPRAKNWDRVSSADGVWESTVAASAVLDPLLIKRGLLPHVSLGARLRRLGEDIAYYARAAKAVAGSVPAIARITSYLLRNDKPDSGRFGHLLRSLGASYTWAAGMHLKVSGRENVPTGTSIVYAMSHRSGLEDAVTMAAVLPTDFAFMAAYGVFPKPLRERLVNQPNLVLVGAPKPGHEGKHVDAVRSSVEALQSGLDLAIFPEGATPTRHQETHPLARGIDAITGLMAERPVAIVAVAMADPSQDYTDRLKRTSWHGPTELAVTFSRPLDPLKFHAVPGATSQLLLDTLRAFYHEKLFWTQPTPATTEDLGTVPAAATAP